MADIEKNGALLKSLLDITEDEDIPQKETNRIHSMALYRILEALEKLNGNPAVQAGSFVQQYPRISAVLGLVAVVLITVWFTSSFRVAVADWLLPEPVFEWLLPYISVMPDFMRVGK